MSARPQLGLVDQWISMLDGALRTLAVPARSRREHPDEGMSGAATLSDEARRCSIELMRINHVGEVCAQALYQGQAITARDPGVRIALERAAHEETEHLAWTARRIDDLGGRKSLLNPLWYGGALLWGVLAGRAGDRWSLGFLAETERQVEAHLSDHLERLPPDDHASAAILRQMREDEAQHARLAESLGAAPLPLPVRMAMRMAAGSMKAIARYV